jgi:hypothetical protein
MTLLTKEEIGNIERRLKDEKNDETKKKINALYDRYKIFVHNAIMNDFILPKLKKYASPKKVFEM